MLLGAYAGARRRVLVTRSTRKNFSPELKMRWKGPCQQGARALQQLAGYKATRLLIVGSLGYNPETQAGPGKAVVGGLQSTGVLPAAHRPPSALLSHLPLTHEGTGVLHILVLLLPSRAGTLQISCSQMFRLGEEQGGSVKQWICGAWMVLGCGRSGEQEVHCGT